MHRKLDFLLIYTGVNCRVDVAIGAVGVLLLLVAVGGVGVARTYLPLELTLYVGFPRFLVAIFEFQ